MKKEEAIRNLEIIKESAKEQKPKNVVLPDVITACEMAIEALKDEKKVPVTTYVMVEGDKDARIDVWACPRCASIIESGQEGNRKCGSFIRERCRWCGQIIDWRNAGSQLKEGE